MMNVRLEDLDDAAAVRRVNEAAFGRRDEADLVDRLRAQSDGYFALVAVDHDEVIGHIAFTPISIDPPAAKLSAVGLAPMAVLPDRQREGIGSMLVSEGLEQCRQQDAGAVFVLGHPRYYPRFGFRPATEYGLTSVYDCPPEAFLVLELRPGTLDDVRGIVHYDPAFPT